MKYFKVPELNSKVYLYKEYFWAKYGISTAEDGTYINLAPDGKKTWTGLAVVPCDSAGNALADHPYNSISTATSAWDTQVGGSHYTGLKIQPMQYSMANNLDALQHTIVKYVTRFRSKNGKEDLLKARDALDKLIEWEDKNATQEEYTNRT